MTTANEAAFPLISPDGMAVNQGLTKREYFAAMAMQGMLSACNGFDNRGQKYLAECAISQADALIKALNETK